MSRPEVVDLVADVLSRMIVDDDAAARVLWAGRRSWATSEEVDAGAGRALSGVHELLAEHDRMRRADVDSGLDDWVFLHSIGIRS